MSLSRWGRALFPAVCFLALTGFDCVSGADYLTTYLDPGPVPSRPSMLVRPMVTTSDWKPLCGLVPAASAVNRNGVLQPGNNLPIQANLRGTDLGITQYVGDYRNIYFGDTIGNKGIWPFAYDPDSIGVVSGFAKNRDVYRLCSETKMVRTAPPGIGASIDPHIQGDFAGPYVDAFINSSDGKPLICGIREARRPDGSYLFPNIPGSFEVPTGAFELGAEVYTYYTSATHHSAPQCDNPTSEPTSAFLTARSKSDPLALHVKYPMDRLDSFTGGHVVNVSPVVKDDYVYGFYTNKYRNSSIYLFRHPTSKIDDPMGVQFYDGATGIFRSSSWWLLRGEPLIPFAGAGGSAPGALGAGELSVRYLAALDLWLMVYVEYDWGTDGRGEPIRVSRGLHTRVAKSPTGPWSAPQVTDMAAFRAQNAAWIAPPSDRNGPGDFYAPYLLPEPTYVAKQGDYQIGIGVLMSTWNPYDVVAFELTMKLGEAP
jgi:hypothetical protein